MKVDLNTRLDEFTFVMPRVGIRLEKAFKSMGIVTVRDLSHAGWRKLMREPNCGRKSWETLDAALTAYGISIGRLPPTPIIAVYGVAPDSYLEDRI